VNSAGAPSRRRGAWKVWQRRSAPIDSATTALREAREAEERDRARGGDGIQHCAEGAGANAIEEEGELEVASRRGERRQGSPGVAKREVAFQENTNYPFGGTARYNFEQQTMYFAQPVPAPGALALLALAGAAGGRRRRG
jgi:MYXO-CTERM domain-containing protein